MLNHPTIQTRLNRLRYGMIAALAVTLTLSLAVPVTWGGAQPAYIPQVLGIAVLHTLAVTLVCTLIYHGYRHWLRRRGT
jgi:hypothetical protein